MIRINLLPRDYLENCQLKRELWLLLALAVCTVLACTVVYFLELTQLEIYRRRVAALDAALRMRQPYVERVKEYERVNESLRELLKDEGINRAALPHDPAGTLARLRALLPQEVRLHSIQFEGETATAAGTSPSYQAVTALLRNLTAATGFDGVELRSVMAVSVAGRGSQDHRSPEVQFTVAWRTTTGEVAAGGE